MAMDFNNFLMVTNIKENTLTEFLQGKEFILGSVD